MYQPWIFATTLAAGGGLVAYAVTLHPSAPADIAPEPPAAVRVIPPAPPARVPEPQATQEPVMELEPVVIQARLHRKAMPAAVPAVPAAVPAVPAAEPAPVDPAAEPAPVDVTVERPCSTWRDIGPTHVVSGTPSGELQVRSLCP